MKLTLEKFGKFENRTFDISEQITLFYGANESGKTTIFDALMMLLTTDKKSNTFTKHIKSRYEEKTKCSFSPKIDEKIKLHPDAYKNLYAIRQSEIIFDLSDTKKDAKDWEQSIKMRLFSSDVDIAKIIAELNAERSGRAQGSIGYNFTKLNEMSLELSNEIDLLYEQISGVNKKNDEMKSINEASENAKLHLQKIILEIEALKASSEIDKKRSSRIEKTNLLSEIVTFLKLDSWLKSNSSFKEDARPEINEIINAIKDCENKQAYLQGQLESVKSQIANKPSIDLESLKTRIENAVEKIDQSVKASPDSKTYKFIIVLSIAAVSSILSVVFGNPTWFLFMLVAVPFLFIRFNSLSKTSELTIIKEIMLMLPELKLSQPSISKLRDELMLALGKLDSETSMPSEANIFQIENEYKMVIEQSEKLKINLRQIFNRLQVYSIEEYGDAKNEYDLAFKNAGMLYSKLINIAKKYSLDSIAALEIEIMRIINQLDIDGITLEAASEDEILRKEHRYNDLNVEMNKVKDKISDLDSKKARLEGEMSMQSDLHIKIIERESELSKINENILALEKRSKALKLLEDLFGKLNKKNEDVFISLANDSKTLYSHITENGFDKNNFEMTGFDKSKIFVPDKENRQRALEYLSSATRDAIYIAMKMSILSRVHEKGRIILLDDPFLTFDSARVYHTILFLKAFTEKHGIPIVMFTKDIAIKEIFEHTLLGSLVHILD